MPWVKCPHCGGWHEVGVIYREPPSEIIIARRLKPVSVAILKHRSELPPAFLRGEPVALRVIADMLDYSYRQVREGMRELADLGVIQTHEYGRNRQRYSANPRLTKAKIAVA